MRSDYKKLTKAQLIRLLRDKDATIAYMASVIAASRLNATVVQHIRMQRGA